MNRLVQARTAAFLAAAALAFAAACERGADGPRSEPPATLTPTSPVATERLHSPLLVRDGGHRFWAGPGQSVLVRLAGSSVWDDLSASAGSVEEVYYRTDPGYREWRATLPARGTVALVARCDGCSRDPWRVVVVIGRLG
jgi:hypothetical protein